MDKRIIVKFTGGLGNQLFEYVFYEWVKSKYPDREVLADLSIFKIHMPHDGLGAWDVFPRMNLKKAGIKDLFDITGEIPIFYGGPLKNKLNSLRKTVNSKFYKKSNLIYQNDNDWVSPEEVSKAIDEGKCYLDSYWQDSEYLEQAKDTVSKVLTFDIENAVPYEADMKKPNAVSLHVRRGDYVGSVFEQEVNEKYYRNAVRYIEEHVPDPHFYIFSDDKEYVRTAFDWISNKTIVEGFDGKKSYMDMYLMSLTPNSIITNSTFSLWAAYLNRNSNAQIVYPDVNYLAHKKMNGWIGIKPM